MIFKDGGFIKLKEKDYCAIRIKIVAGISSRAALYAALQVARRLGSDKNVLTILPDTGESYSSMEIYFKRQLDGRLCEKLSSSLANNYITFISQFK